MGNALFWQGGVLVLSSGDDWIDEPGAMVTLRNSSFRWNEADLDNGAVANVEKFALLTVEGDGNVFEKNACGADGGVIASTTDSLVIIQGGTFTRNTCLMVSRVPGARCGSPIWRYQKVFPLLLWVWYRSPSAIPTGQMFSHGFRIRPGRVRRRINFIGCRVHDEQG